MSNFTFCTQNLVSDFESESESESECETVERIVDKSCIQLIKKRLSFANLKL